MGYIGNLQGKLTVQKLRKDGLSYSEIKKIINIPKSTLSGWCRDIILTESQISRLVKNKIDGATLGRIIGARKQQARRQLETKQMFIEGKKQVGNLTKRDRF